MPQEVARQDAGAGEGKRVAGAGNHTGKATPAMPARNAVLHFPEGASRSADAATRAIGIFSQLNGDSASCSREKACQRVMRGKGNPHLVFPVGGKQAVEDDCVKVVLEHP